MELQNHFENIRQIIRQGQVKALQAAYTEQLKVYWNVGAYVNQKLDAADWGAKVVDTLATWLKENEPTLKGFDRRTLYRMQEFYLTWYSVDWKALKTEGAVIVGSKNPQLQNAKKQSVGIVGSETPQLLEMPLALGKLSWTHHIELLKRASSLEERIFYLLLGIKEGYTVTELKRQIKTSLYERQKMSSQKIIADQHPAADKIPQIFRDKYIFEFLDLPEPHNEYDFQKALIGRLKQFILELGRDFIFMGEEYHLQVGKRDYYIDLLFFHRELQCIVGFELKVQEFEPEYLGKLNFYLEALDRDVKKPHENPSIGVLLCKSKDKEVVEYALSRNISPALVAAYETKMIDKGLLQRMLHEWAESIDSNE
ncbi:MAG: PDDEXK nuclease domain-containing protein [Chitinophagaceae bacterium]